MISAVRESDTLFDDAPGCEFYGAATGYNLAFAGIAACGKGRVYRGYKREETGA